MRQNKYTQAVCVCERLKNRLGKKIAWKLKLPKEGEENDKMATAQ